MEPLRLVFVTAVRRWTGGERCMTTVASGLAARGHAVVCTYDPRGPVGPQISSSVRAVPITVRGDLDPIACMQLGRLIHQHAADIVCVNSFRELKLGGAAARMAGRARVVNRRGSCNSVKAGLRTRLLYQWLLDMVIRDCQAGCKSLREAAPWLQRPVVQCRNGVDVTALAAVRPAERAALGALPGEILIASLDRAGRRKGSPEMAAAARLAATQRDPNAPPLRLVLIGQLGEIESEIRETLASVAAHVKVSFLGHLSPSDTLRTLAACDIITRMSRTDGLSFAVLEGMAMGIPVIATNIGGLSELVLDGETGRLVPPGDLPQLAEALSTLAANPELRRRMGDAGRMRVQLEFDELRMINDYETAFRAAAAQAPDKRNS